MNYQNPDTIPFLVSVRETPLNPVQLRRLFLIVTRMHFSNPANYGKASEQLAGYRYSVNDNERTVDVDLGAVYPPDTVDKYPAISVDIGQVVLNAPVVGNVAGHSGERAMGASTDLIITHHSMKTDEAYLLASLTCDFYTGYGEYLRNQFGLQRFSPMGLGALELKKNPERPLQVYQVAFNAKIHFSFEWNFTAESHTIQSASVGTVMQLSPETEK